MTLDWILGVGTVVFAITTWATLSFGYAYFRELGRRDEQATTGTAAEPVELAEAAWPSATARPVAPAAVRRS